MFIVKIDPEGNSSKHGRRGGAITGGRTSEYFGCEVPLSYKYAIMCALATSVSRTQLLFDFQRPAGLKAS